MRSPYFTEEHQLFRETVHQFLEKEVTPFASQWEKEERIPREIWLKMGEQDLLGIPFPENYGGSNADFFFSVIFLEALGALTPGGFAAAVGVHVYIALSYIHHFGSDILKAYYLPAGIRGEKIGALAVTEPDAGSDVAAIRTRARREGEGYILNGAKTFITNGVYGDFIVVAAKTDPDAGTGGISLLIVDSDSPGVTASKLKKIGWHCSDTAEITFDNVRVPASNLLGKENMGFYYLMEMFQLERLVAAITAMAGADYCLDLTLNYISQREAFGKPLSRFQAIRHSLSDLAAEVEAARQLTYYASWLYQQNFPAVRQCSMAKLYTTELAKRVADTCLQFFGGYGYMDEYLISRIYRDARVGTIVGGASEVMREIISKLLIDHVEYQNREGEPTSQTTPEPSPEAREEVVASPVGEASRELHTPEGDPGVPEKELSESSPVQPGEIVETVDESAVTPPTNGEGEPSAMESDPSLELEQLFQEASLSLHNREQPEIEEVPTREEIPDKPSAQEQVESRSGEAHQPPPPPVNDVSPDTIPDNEADSLQQQPSELTAQSIIHTLPSRFRATKAGDYHGVIHFKISGEKGGEFTVRIEGDTCLVENGCVGKADCVVETVDKTYLEMETGKLNPQIAFMMGKVKVSNVPEMLQFTQLFDPLPDT